MKTLTHKQRTIIYIAISLVVLALGIYFFTKHKKINVFQPFVAPTPADPATTAAEPTNMNQPLQAEADDFPLSVGSRGKRVEQLQLWMFNNHGLKSGTIANPAADGIFGAKTLDNLKRALKTDKVAKDLFEGNKMQSYKTYVYA